MTDEALLVAIDRVLERIDEVYRPEYVAKVASSEPDSLLGRCEALRAAAAEHRAFRATHPPI